MDILFVEDSEKVCEIFISFLRMKGHRVREARNGEDAIQRIMEQPADLVIMDVKMPKLDGLSAFREIRRIAPATKVILMTGFTVKEEFAQAQHEGALECLRKPILLKDLETVVARAALPSAVSEAEDDGRPAA